jgi:carbon-monoxide dehydrogenase medium subunit
VKPSAFRYVRPPDVVGVLRAMRDDPDAKVIAGGQSLVPMMNLRLARPGALIDIDRMDGLARVFEDVDSLIIGALVRHRRLERDPLVARRTPLLREVARHIGHVGIRNRGTLGGTLAHADPAAELPLAMVTLDATVHAESLDRGRRAIPAADFFTSLYTTELDEDELVTWVRVPAMPDRAGWGFAEFARRPGDFAMAGAAALVRLDPSGAVAHVRAALMSVGDRPLLVANGPLPAGRTPGAEVAWGEVAAVWTAELPTEDGYTRHLARVALGRALRDAHVRAATGEGDA